MQPNVSQTPDKVVAETRGLNPHQGNETARASATAGSDRALPSKIHATIIDACANEVNCVPPSAGRV